MPEKILIVDDDLETLRLVGIMLQRQGYEIAAATNGSQAITMATNEHPDLIILDIMMPGMDGLEVTEVLRKDPQTQNIPILMFTAKSQVDDKVAGYDSGADDYLTKPVHPAELTAHIKSLLARTRNVAEPVPAAKSGYLIGVIGCKGGLGTSTLALNLAISIAETTKKPVVAAEVRPGQGSWAMELGITAKTGIESLLKLPKMEITSQKVEDALSRTSFGVRLLLASNEVNPVEYQQMQDKAGLIIRNLMLTAPIIVLDIGTPYMPVSPELCDLCHHLLVLTDSTPVCTQRTKIFLESVQDKSTHLAKRNDLILYNRSISSSQLTAVQVSGLISDTPVELMVPPAPELAYQAVQQQTPMILAQPNGLIAQQINEYTRVLLQQIRP